MSLLLLIKQFENSKTFDDFSFPFMVSDLGIFFFAAAFLNSSTTYMLNIRILLHIILYFSFLCGVSVLIRGS